MTKRALTATQVAALSDHTVHWVAPSLYLQIRPQGTKSWLFRYWRDGTNQWVGLGSLADKPLSEARDEAAMLRVLVKRGGDPIGDKRQVQADRAGDRKSSSPTFDECAKLYIAAHEAGWKNEKHIAQWKSTLRMYAGPVIGKKRVDEIAVEDVLKVLKPIWTTKPETASRLRGRIEKVLGWAAAMKYRGAENPAAWAGPLQHLLPVASSVQKVEHHKAVPYREVPKLMAELRKNGSISAKALMFTILTASRTSEVLGATWDEFDFVAKIWTIPANRMKAGREHRVPLTDQAIAILKGLQRDEKYVFHNEYGRKLSNMAMLMLLRGIRDDGSTVHGFRSSFRDWAAEQTNTPREVVEACLAHAVGDAAELAYKRSDFLEKRREVMKAWATFVKG